MRAAVIEELGGSAACREFPDPEPKAGERVVDMLAAALNPADLAVANGTFYAGHPPLPYVPALEAVGRLADGPDAGRLVYVQGGGLGVSRDGTAAERFGAPADILVEIPDNAEPAVAAALGTAGLAGWLSLSWRAQLRPGETVLVLGATGAVGSVALQCARALGAGRVVAAGRDRAQLAKCAEIADAVVPLEHGTTASDFSAACEGGANVILDALWGNPLVAALGAARPGARVVHVGASAGAVAEVPSAPFRGKQLELLGYSNFAVPREVLVAAYLDLVRRSIEGTLRLDVIGVPLTEATRAWAGLRSGGKKFVLTA